jgi:hypothetical protein
MAVRAQRLRGPAIRGSRSDLRRLCDTVGGTSRKFSRSALNRAVVARKYTTLRLRNSTSDDRMEHRPRHLLALRFSVAVPSVLRRVKGQDRCARGTTCKSLAHAQERVLRAARALDRERLTGVSSVLATGQTRIAARPSPRSIGSRLSNS